MPRRPADLANLAASFARSLRAANRAPRTIAAYGEAVARLDEFLAARGIPRHAAA